MRVLHVIDKLSMDGVNPSSCTVLFGGWNECLVKSGCETLVLSLAQDQEVGDYLRKRGIEDHYCSHRKFSPRIVREIGEYAAARKVDLVHLHGYGAAHFGRLAARKSGLRNVVHEHAVLKVKPQHYVIDRLLRSMTDAAVAVSENVKEFMIKGRSIPADRIRVIGNGIDLSRFREKTPADIVSARGIMGLSMETPVVGVVTRFREEKGTDDLLKAFGLIRRKVPNAHLVVIGDGPLKEALRKLAEEENLAGAVSWLGFRQDVERIMPAFNVQVIPSLSEGFGLALAEGMAIGNPMVATEVGGMQELGRDRQNLLFVPPRDPISIADACVALLTEPECARDVARGGLETAKSLDIAHSATAIFKLYQALLATGN